MSGTGRIVKQYGVQEYVSIDQLHAKIRSDFHNLPLRKRPKFRLIPEYVEWLQNGTKCTTVRYRPDAIDVPTASELPLIESTENDQNHIPESGSNHRVGYVRITDMVIKPFGLLDDQDAHRDGFLTENQLKGALQKLYEPNYGVIDEAQFVTIYAIELVQPDR